MGRDSSFLVIFKKPSITIDDAERALAYWKPTRDGDGLEIAAGKTMIAIGLSDEPHVILESADLAERAGIPGIATCPRRFECLVDDLEEALHEYTTLSGIQEDLQRLTEGWVFLTWNGNVLEM
jgi:hypothetical protein